MHQLLNDAQREVVADVVNAALLASATGKPKWEVKPQVSSSSNPNAPAWSSLAVACCLDDTKANQLEWHEQPHARIAV